ncbi:MAG: T9SS type A sorting domain-containing protein [Bacteroidales bacterium]|nr:T9SS type A sorting domain-containing protein [Bacteroidales bacterium]
MIYPNPATNTIILKCDNHHIHKVDIYDVLGKKIFSTSNNHIIDISQLPPGLYILKADYLTSIFEKIPH